MAGTTVNEGGIVYQTLYDTIKDYGLNINKQEINKWHGANKYEVLNYYLENDNTFLNSKNTIQSSMKKKLHDNFNTNLKERYFSSDNIKLIDNKMPNLFEYLRSNDIKIALNTGYNKDIQQAIISKLHMNKYIDDYISSEEVENGRPYPHMINKLISRNNIPHSKNVIKFGDTKNDILEGINANCLASVGVLSGADTEQELSNASMIINSIIEME
jgi:phosphonatase-like hydrolase